ncbi:MAG: hypothetical protein ACHQTE_00890 [Candidatus Saccharimonadales bacterium]
MNIISKSLIVLASVASLLAAGSPSAHATSASTCVDGTVRSNLVITWKSNNNVTVGTVANKPLCKDVTVFFSSYTMPDNYNGKPFANNPTASPQTSFDSVSVVLQTEATKAVSMTIKLPEACKNVQVDTYYGPQITTVGPAGHANQYISGKILVKTADTCVPVTPETPAPPAVVPPVEAQTPPTPPAEVIVTPQVPAELPHTGSNMVATFTTGAALSALTYVGAFVVTKRR